MPRRFFPVSYTHLDVYKRQYLNDLRSGNAAKESEVFQRRLDRYRERYIFPENETTPTEEKQG